MPLNEEKKQATEACGDLCGTLSAYLSTERSPPKRANTIGPQPCGAVRRRPNNGDGKIGGLPGSQGAEGRPRCVSSQHSQLVPVEG